jgi:hypothetical protein
MLGIGLSSCCLTLLLTIIQLYRGGQFLLLEETGVPEKTIRNQTIYLYKVILCTRQGPSWRYCMVSWTYNYLCNQSLSPLML